MVLLLDSLLVLLLDSLNGVVARQFIGCQHHILDLVLQHLLGYLFTIDSKTLNINYQFIKEVLAEYEDLQKSYSGKEKILMHKNPGWRDDFRFLFELCEAYNFYKKEGHCSQVQLHKLPSL